MDKAFLQNLYEAHRKCPDCPSPEIVSLFFTDLLSTLFPDFAKKRFSSPEEVALHLQELQMRLSQLLFRSPQQPPLNWEGVASQFFEELPLIHYKLSQDVQAMFEGDPAAGSPNEVVRTYPGFYAIAAYRVAHELYKRGVRVIPRIITQHAHSKTGIDIHPGAQIGDYFCIDHGTGIVIGQTAVIGNRVKIYQGVTLGALSVRKEDAEVKRHPTIEDGVTIYAGATILGGETVIGQNSIIGGNVWVTRSVAASTKMYYKASVHSKNSEEGELVVSRTKI